jgi:3-methylfumaryl-CoA hydratase
MAAEPDLGAWVGRGRSATETLDAGAVARLAAFFDMERPPAPEGIAPEGWHWLFFLSQARASEIGPDGHSRRGGFMPPVPLPRRMFAGASMAFGAPLRLGAPCTLTETIARVEEKTGRTGILVFVEVERVLRQADGEPSVTERQTIVYRDIPAAPAPVAGPDAPAGAEWDDAVTPDPVMLFRFSALTFNSHRIHYDRAYATGAENYPGLVVHGPLIALLLLESARRRMPGRPLGYRFRAVAPLFEPGTFTLSGRRDGGTAHLWARAGTRLAMSAEAEFQAP